MSHRVVTDATGTSWQVWTVLPAGPAGRSSVAVAPGYAEGWLVFEELGGTRPGSPEKRRLAPVPPNWAAAPEDEVLALLDAAARVVPRIRTIGRG